MQSAVSLGNGDPPAKLRVLIVDDQKTFLDALAEVLLQTDDVELVGRTTDAREVPALTEKLKPDLVLTDLAMPIMDGYAVAQLLKSGKHRPKVAIVSFHAESEYREMAAQAGADGYFVKNELRTELLPWLKQLRSTKLAGS